MRRMTLLPWVLGTPNDAGYNPKVAVCHIWTAKGPGYGLVATTIPYGSAPSDESAGNAEYIHRAAMALPVLSKAVTDLMALAIETKGCTPEQATMICHIGTMALAACHPRPAEKPNWVPFSTFKSWAEAYSDGYVRPTGIGRGGWERIR